MRWTTPGMLAALTAVAVASGAGLGLAVWRVVRPEVVQATAEHHDGTQDPTTVVTDPVGARPDAPDGVPNVVLVIACTLRRDQTSVYGGPAGTTPALERIAREGVRFDDVVAAAPWTRAASTALLTGHHAVSLGLVEPGTDRSERVLPPQATTLAEHLRSQGYATAGLTTNPNLNDTYGFHQGFDAYRQPAALWRDDPRRIDGDEAVPRALATLDLLEPGRPVFLEVVLVDAHAPHYASDETRARFAEDGVPDDVVAYRAAVARLDAAIAALDEGLAERGLGPDNTLFVVVSDHGEGLGWPVHHGRSHGRYLAPSAVGAVWVMRGPGVARGQVVRGLASQVDVAPTLLALAGLPPLDAPGREWASAARGAADATDRELAFSDTWFKEANRAAVYGAERACQVDFTPRIRGPGNNDFQTGCFDRRADPQHAVVLEDDALTERLLDWRRERVSEGVARGPAGSAVPSAELDAQLEALGYVSGDDPEPEDVP